MKNQVYVYMEPVTVGTALDQFQMVPCKPKPFKPCLVQNGSGPASCKHGSSCKFLEERLHDKPKERLSA